MAVLNIAAYYFYLQQTSATAVLFYPKPSTGFTPSYQLSGAPENANQQPLPTSQTIVIAAERGRLLDENIYKNKISGAGLASGKNPNTPIFKDWYILGLTTGMASAAVKTVLNQITAKVGIPTVPYGILAGDMVMGRRRNWLESLFAIRRPRAEYAVGYLADVVFGGILGVATSFLYSHTPPGNEVLKGALGGAAVWAATFTIPNQMRVSKITSSQLATVLFMDIFWGAMQGALIGRYGSMLIQQSHPVPVKPMNNKEYNQGRLSIRRQPSLM